MTPDGGWRNFWVQACQPRLLGRGLILMAGLAVVGWAISAGLSHLSAADWVDRLVRGHGVIGLVWFLAISAAVVGIGLPRQTVGFAGGYAFGLGWGCLLALFGQLLGCLAAFGYARLLARSALRRRFPGRVHRLDQFLQDHPITMTMLVRLLPTPGLLTNLAAGVSSVPTLPFLVGSALGYLPQTIVFVLLGQGTRVNSAWPVIASVVLFIVSTLLGGLLYRWRRGKADAVLLEGDAP